MIKSELTVPAEDINVIIFDDSSSLEMAQNSRLLVVLAYLRLAIVVGTRVNLESNYLTLLFKIPHNNRFVI